MRESLMKTIEGARLMNGKVAMITGAASGIGKACAEIFSHQGCKLILVDINDEGLKRVGQEITQGGGEAVIIHGDVTREKDLDRIFQLGETYQGGMDILINNAGGGLPTEFFSIPAHEWDQIIRLNLTSIFLMSQRAALIFRRKGKGVIVNIASQAGRSVSPTAGCHYTASKAGVLGFTRHAATILAPFNIRVNAVCPGITNSERIVKRLHEQGRMEEAGRSIPLGRIGDVYDIAGSWLFLASDLSDYITGVSLDVNGGSLMM